jgi:hypothetical protein
MLSVMLNRVEVSLSKSNSKPKHEDFTHNAGDLLVQSLKVLPCDTVLIQYQDGCQLFDA